MPDQWPRALLRAALREAGYDAVGTRALELARHLAGPQAGRGPVRLIVLEQEAFSATNRSDLEALSQATSAPVVLLAPAARPLHEGSWAQVIRRPVSVGELVQVVERLVPLTKDERVALDE